MSSTRLIAVRHPFQVLREWHTPRHEEFQPRTAWSLFNAFTEARKQVNPHTAICSGEALHRVFDVDTGAMLRKN